MGLRQGHRSQHFGGPDAAANNMDGALESNQVRDRDRDHHPLAIASEFGVALLVGLTVDLFRPSIRNRLHAAAVGSLAWLPAMILILFLVGRGQLSWPETIELVAVGALFIGGIGGAFLFSPPQEPL